MCQVWNKVPESKCRLSHWLWEGSSKPSYPVHGSSNQVGFFKGSAHPDPHAQEDKEAMKRFSAAVFPPDGSKVDVNVPKAGKL